MRSFFYTLDVLLSTLGQPIFESLSIKERNSFTNQSSSGIGIPLISNVEISPIDDSQPTLFYYIAKDSDAKGYYDDDGFVILAGSLIRQEQAVSAPPFVTKLKESLLSSGKLVAVDNKSYKLTENQIFKTPSGASSLVSGRSTNGWIEWKNEAGETLDEVYR